MALWPFRRKSGRKRPRSGAALSDAEGPPARSQTEDNITRAASKKKQRTESGRLQRRPRAYSFSPGRQDDLGVERAERAADASGPRGRSRNGDDQNSPITWDRTPTLHHKRSKRKKSGRRKREDHDRAAEIKAMSSFAPLRPATDSATAGRPMKKDSKKFRSGPGFGAHPASDVSLPIPESIHSSMSSDSEYGSYKVTAALAPRPTLRYAPASRWTPSQSSTAAQASYQKKPSNKEVLAGESYRRNRRIDDLANELDSSDLRELMEREDRRRELRKQRERERAERRLNRQAAKQKAEEAEAAKSGTPPPENLERGVAGREMVGLGIDPESTVRTSSKHRTSGSSEHLPDAGSSNDDDNAQQRSPKSPLEAFHRPDSVIMEDAVLESETLPPPTTESVEPIPAAPPVPQAQPQDSTTSLTYSTRFGGLLKSKKSRSKSTLASEREKTISPAPGTIDEELHNRRTSTGSDKRGRFSLSSFIRWGGRHGRNSAEPSSFSNTSREEMHAAAAAQSQAQAQAQAAQAQALAKLQGEDAPANTEPSGGVYMSRKPSASGVTRTRSRFREDLPDFLMSPPDSRVQSPEAEPPLPSLAEHSPGIDRTQPIAIPTPKDGSPTAHRQTPNSTDRLQGISPEPHMSLASIDSEGSWLSGNAKAKRSSINRESLIRANRLGATHASNSPTNSTQEDLAITDDYYLSRYASNRYSAGHLTGRPSGEGRPSSDEEDYVGGPGPRWGAVGSQPQVTHSHKHDRTTMQSQEGLLNIDSGDEDSIDSPLTPTAQEKADEASRVQRARSVHLGRGHVRNFSAGSAKLLDLTPRSSVDGKLRNRDGSVDRNVV